MQLSFLLFFIFFIVVSLIHVLFVLGLQLRDSWIHLHMEFFRASDPYRLLKHVEKNSLFID